MSVYGDYCPMSRAAEIFATRWTPLIVRNLLLGCRTFTEIRAGAPGISRTLLTQRLRMLEHHGVIDRVPGAGGHVEYVPTPAGEALLPVVDALGAWGEQWVDLAPEHFDGARVMWALSRKLRLIGDLPEQRVVIRFDIRRPQRESYWLLLDAPAVEVCNRPPGDEEELVVRAQDAETLVRWHVGDMTAGEAEHAGALALDGERWLQRLFASWGGQASYLAPAAPSAL